MGLFDKVDDSATTEVEKDFVPGQRKEPLPSDVYDLVIKYAYGAPSKSGAIGIHCMFEVASGEYKERTVRSTEYVTSGDAKGKRTYYEQKTDKGVKQRKLPGYLLMNDMALLVANKGIMKCKSEERTIKLYDFDSKSEVPTKVQMFTELVGKGVRGCVSHHIEDKQAKNTQTGEYEATGKTYATNVIEKFLSAADYRTASEIRNNAENADYKDQWLARWQNQINDQSTGVDNAGTAGAPVASGNAAEKSALFQ